MSREERHLKKVDKQMRKAIAKFTKACDTVKDCDTCPFRNCYKMTLGSAMSHYLDGTL